MGLGYALVHPLQVERTIGHDVMKLGFDDGIDVVLAGIGFGDVGPARQAAEDEFQRQLDNVFEQIASLLQSSGPLVGLMGLGAYLDAERIDWAAIAERAADFLCHLEPAVVHGLLVGLLNNTAHRLPLFDTAEIAVRVRGLADALIAPLEAPLLSGRDDLAAHRGYRAAAMLRLLLRDVFDGLDLLLRQADPLGALRSVFDAIPDLDVAVVTGARAIGCWVKDNVVPILRCLDEFQFSASVDLEGPLRMPAVATRDALLELDGVPSPLGHEHWLWWVDLSTSLIGFATTIFDLQRTSNPVKRVAHFIADLLLPMWIAFRTLARAFRWPFINGPPDGSDNARRFVRFLFSDFGDFCVQFFIHFIGSISDMYAWSNWISSLGLRILRYFFYVLQPRMIYLFLRGAWYARQWDALPEEEKEGGMTMPRFAWLMYGPMALLCFIVGLFFGGLKAGWRNFSIRGSGPVGPIVSSILAALVSYAFTPPIVLRHFEWFRPSELKRDQWQSALVIGLAILILVIALLTFFQTDNGLSATDAPWKVALWVLALLALVGVFVIWPAFSEGWSHYAYYGAILLFGLLFPGVMMVIAWWFAIADGADREDVFEGRNPASSPYLLPYPSGESWLCGQGFHGFFSHEKLNTDGTENFANHYSYDFSEDFGERGIAARTGIVVVVRDGLDNHNTEQNNRVEVLHLDWQEGHDPGWNEERSFTYSAYLHIQQRGARVTLGQVAHRGRHLVDVDDTGVSAMNHLHYMGQSGQNSDNGIINMPVVFRDEGVRRDRSAGMMSGKPMSLAFFESENTVIDDLAPAAVVVPLSTDAGHTHAVSLQPGDLAADGTIPASVALTTAAGGAPAHIHQLSFDRDHVEDLLRRRNVDGATGATAGHTHTVQPLQTQPVNSALAGAGTTQASMGFQTATFAVADPPQAQLLARRPGPHQLLGEQMLLRVNGRATEWYTFGARRPRLAADLVLDRGPGAAAAVEVSHNGTAASGSAGADLMARTAAMALTTALQAAIPVTVRAQPVIVIETRRRGTTAALVVTAAPLALVPTPTGATVGSGAVARLDQVTRQELRDVIVAGLTQQAGVPLITVTGTGDSRTITSGGGALTGFGGSTPRIQQVMAAVYVAGTRAIDNANPLPLTGGVLRANVPGGQRLDVPLSASPARVLITDLATARLTGAELVAEPLVVGVRADQQPVHFDAADTTAEALAQRIGSQAEGVRSWAEGAGVVIETVAAGDQVRLTLAKGTATFPAATPGAAPVLGTVRMADSTSVTLDDLGALIASARAEAVRATAPAAVTVPSGALRIAANVAGTAVAIEGPADLMAALGAAPAAPGAATTRVDAPDAVELTGLPNTLNLPIGGWLDVTVGAETWRIDLPAEPARVELALETLPATGDQLQFTVNGNPISAVFGAGDIGSSHAVAARIAAAAGVGADGVTVRVASRYSVEGAAHGEGDLEVGSPTSPGSASAGVLVQGRTRTGRGAYPDTTSITTLDSQRATDGRIVRAFAAAFTGSRVDVTAAGGGPITITPVDVDPFGLATGAVTGGPFVMGEQSVAYEIEAASTTTFVEFNGGPAQLHTIANAAAVQVVDGASTLAVTTTPPAGPARSSTVELRGVASLDEAAARIQRDAPHVLAWTRNGTRLDVDTPSGGTAWQLRLEGREVLIALGFDPNRIDAAGGISVLGSGNVADAAAVTRTEIRDVVDTMGGLATFDEAQRFATSVAGGALRVTGVGGPPVLRSVPPAVVTPLATTTTGNVLATGPQRFRLEAGWLVLEVAGAVASVGALWGRRAWLEAPSPVPASPTADLNALKSAKLRITVDGNIFNLTLPTTAFATVEALLGHLNRAVGAGGRAWFGLVSIAGAKHIRLESRRRGSTSDIIFEFVSGTPLLGFAVAVTTATVSGGGSVVDLNRVTADELRTIVEDGRGFADTPQPVIDVSVAGTDLRLVARGGFRTRLTAAVAPEGLAPVNPPGRLDILVAPYATPNDTGTHLTVLQVNDSNTGPTVNQAVRALLRAEPARLGPMTLPTNRSALDGRNLRLNAGGTAFVVNFTGTVDNAAVIDQIERAGEGLVRATVVVAGAVSSLFVETIAEGTSAALSVNPASTAFGVLGAPLANSGAGSGDCADVRAVTADQYRAVLAAGRLGPPVVPGGVTPDRSVADNVLIRASRHAHLTSDRWGCRSTLEILPLEPGARVFEGQLAAGPRGLELDRSFGWGPAVRASVALPALGSPVNLSGELWITLNDNGAAVDVAPPADVRVPLDGTFDARALADTIDRALVGLGAAVAFPDGVVVIETLAPGLSGTVRVPSQANVSTPAVVTALGLSGPPLAARGWPGSGMRNGSEGFRGFIGNARAQADWQFTLPGGVTVPAAPFTVTAGQTPAQVAAALDPLLLAGAGNRLGIAAVGDDGSLCVEFFGQNPGTVAVNGVAGPEQPRGAVVWEGGDRRVDEAFELRPTRTVRTFRGVFIDLVGDDGVFVDPAVFDPNSPRTFDLGWVRCPTNANGAPQAVQRWAPGRWLLAVRADGARSDSFAGDTRTRAYAPSGEMVIAAGTATVAGATFDFVRQARYWINHRPVTGITATAVGVRSVPLRVVRFGAEFLVDHLNFPG